MNGTHGLVRRLGISLAMFLLAVAPAGAQTTTGTISANPTTALVALGQTLAATSISFTTTPATVSQVYVKAAGGQEVLFAQAADGSNLSAPWIQEGVAYDFNLYAGTARTRLLATIRVTGARGTIAADPWTDVIIPPGQTFGTATVTFSAPGATEAVVYVRVNGGPENPNHLIQGTGGSATAPWIQDGATYDFNLYEGPDRAKLLATVRVFGRKYEYRVGVYYHATGANFDTTSFLADYHLPSVRSTVKSQLQAMADRGASVIKTGMWLVDADQSRVPAERWKWHFPPTAQELANLRLFVQDVAAVEATDGRRLRLELTTHPQWASLYEIGTPSTTLGHMNLAPDVWKSHWITSYQTVIDAVHDILRPDGVKVVELMCLQGEIMVGAIPNTEWFLQQIYPGFVSYAQAKGIKPSLYFNVDGNEAAVLDDAFTDGAYPILNGHRSMFWVYRTVRFLRDNGLFIPERIDFSTYPNKVSSSYSTLVQRIFDDADATLPSLGARKWYAAAETFYLPDQTARQELGKAFLDQRKINNRMSQLTFWTTPDAGGPGVHTGFPFAIEDYLPVLDPSDFRAHATRDGGDVLITWPSVIGRTFKVQARNSLMAGGWTNLATGFKSTEYREAFAPGTRFYRVVSE
jgi:hypothetical protein